ncbi:hypothetical protein ACFQU7_41105 [Pseudoroseomonas wenyumeiae]
MVHDDFVLYESAAINLYLAEKAEAIWRVARRVKSTRSSSGCSGRASNGASSRRSPSTRCSVRSS